MFLYSRLSYPAWKAHIFYAAFYCRLWPAWLYHIFPLYLIKYTFFGRKVTEQKSVCFYFLYNACLKHF
jgi:hypothetical protein